MWTVLEMCRSHLAFFISCKRIFAKSRIFDTACRIEIDMRFIENEVA